MFFFALFASYRYFPIYQKPSSILGYNTRKAKENERLKGWGYFQIGHLLRQTVNYILFYVSFAFVC
jgi:hypothetical protein